MPDTPQFHTAAVTGASSGIGRELALQLAPSVSRMILVARRQDQLDELATQLSPHDLQVEVRPCDLGDRQSRTALADELADEDIDLLVCAAGFGADGFFDELELGRMESMIEVNLVSAMHFTRMALPGMVQRGRGSIVMVGSGAGVWPMQKSTAYAATKAGMHGFCDALRLDLTGTGVTVTEALPGPVSTEFDVVAGLEKGMASPASGMKIDAAACANDIVRAVQSGQQVVYPGKKYRRLMRFSDLLPRPLARKMAAKDVPERDFAEGS